MVVFVSICTKVTKISTPQKLPAIATVHAVATAHLLSSPIKRWLQSTFLIFIMQSCTVDGLISTLYEIVYNISYILYYGMCVVHVHVYMPVAYPGIEEGGCS